MKMVEIPGVLEGRIRFLGRSGPEFEVSVFLGSDTAGSIRIDEASGRSRITLLHGVVLARGRGAFEIRGFRAPKARRLPGERRAEVGERLEHLAFRLTTDFRTEEERAKEARKTRKK